MRIVSNTPDRFVLRDRTVLAVLALLTIAAICGTLGTLAAWHGDDAMARIGGTVFALAALLLVAFAAFVAREHTHVFDRRRGVLQRRVRRLIGPGEEREIPLAHVRGVDLVVDREVVDPDTYGLELLIATGDGAPPTRLPLRDHRSSADLGPVKAALERWLAARP